MKKYPIMILVIFFLWIYGCSEDSTTAPEDDGNYNLETTGTIGPAGGTIEIDDLLLSIPAGAFEEDQTIEIYASSDDQPFGDDQITRSFRLKGLPDDYSQPIHVKIQYEGLLSGETYVAQGARFFDYDMHDTTTVYLLHAALDSSGYLISDIPATQEGSPCLPSPVHLPHMTANGAADAIELLGLDGYGTRETAHFSIHYPQDLVSVSIASVGTMLEEIYSVVTDTLSLPWLWVSKMQTVITDIESGDGAYFGFLENNAGSVLNLSRTHLSSGNFTPVRLDAGHWLLGYILGSFDQNAIDPAHYWLWNAVVTWAEEEFTDDDDFESPSKFSGNEMAPFHGLRAGAGINQTDFAQAINHGCGISPVIAFLFNDPRFGKNGIGNTYETIWMGSNATSALLNNVNALVTEWWPEFFKSYVEGEIYGVGKDVFLAGANLSGTWTIDDGNDTDSTFTLNYPDLSVKQFKINLEYGSIDPAASLTLDLSSEVSTPISVMLFGVEGNELKYWGHSTAQGSTSLLVPDVRNLYDDGWRELLVVVVNCDVSDTYLEETDITLEMKVLSGPSNLEYTGCAMDLTNMHLYLLLDYQDPGEEDVEIEVNRGFDSDYRTGSMTGDTFRANWEYEEQGTTYEGAIEATFIGNPPTTITSLDFTQTKRTDQETRIDSLVMSNVPITETWDGGCRIELQASAVCDYVDQLVITRGYTIYQEVMQGWECNDDSFRTHILIGFSEN